MGMLQRIEQAFIKAHKAGDSANAKILAGEIKRYLQRQESRKVSAKSLEEEARKKGLTDAQIQYAYETDKLIGAPKGATLAQIKQESGFNPRAKSPTGALGLTQFTQTGVADVLFGRKPVGAEEQRKVVEAKQSLYGNVDGALEFQRKLLTTIQRRSKGSWDSVLRAYNGDTKLEANGLEARDNYITKIKGYLGQ